jgi:outer membrane lipoprotein SlyB
MKNTLKVLLLSLLLGISLVGCATRSQTNYFASETGQQLPVEDVVILSSRLVTIEGLTDDKRPGWGAAVGAAVAGATAYGVTKSDNPAGVAITIVAAIGGAIAGQFIDEKSKSTLGAEYLVLKENGDKVIVVQSIENQSDMLPKNTAASMIGGKYNFVRVVPR